MRVLLLFEFFDGCSFVRIHFCTTQPAYAHTRAGRHRRRCSSRTRRWRRACVGNHSIREESGNVWLERTLICFCCCLCGWSCFWFFSVANLLCVCRTTRGNRSNKRFLFLICQIDVVSMRNLRICDLFFELGNIPHVGETVWFGTTENLVCCCRIVSFKHVFCFMFCRWFVVSKCFFCNFQTIICF